MTATKQSYKPFQKHPFFIKLFNREYWPMWANYFPVYFYFLFLSLRERSFFWFSAANPVIENGGMMGESKMNILNRIPDEYKPISIFIPKGTDFKAILTILKNENVDFPLVIKPDVGERGTLVEKVKNAEELAIHIQKNDVDYIIQPYIDYKVELAIMYYHFHDKEEVHVFSITQKAFLSLEGDGKSTIEELVMKNSRAILQLQKLQTKYNKQWHQVLAKGEKIELEPIGNHARGTMFLDANYINDDALKKALHPIIKSIDGIYFGRFDMRVKSIEDLKQGKNIAILEINGVGAEPAHIYDPNYSLWATYKTLLKQWYLMHKISRYNHKTLGIPYMTFAEAKQTYRDLKTYHKTLKL